MSHNKWNMKAVLWSVGEVCPNQNKYFT